MADWNDPIEPGMFADTKFTHAGEQQQHRIVCRISVADRVTNSPKLKMVRENARRQLGQKLTELMAAAGDGKWVCGRVTEEFRTVDMYSDEMMSGTPSGEPMIDMVFSLWTVQADGGSYVRLPE